MNREISPIIFIFCLFAFYASSKIFLKNPLYGMLSLVFCFWILFVGVGCIRQKDGERLI